MALWDNNQGKWVFNLAAPLPDASPNNYSLARQAAGSTLAVAGHAGGVSKAISISGGAYYNIADASAPNLKITGALTISLWVNPQTLAAATFYALVAKWGVTNGSYSYIVDLSWASSTTANVRFYLSNDGTTLTGLTSTATISNNAWTHIAAVYDGAYIYIYLNGVLDSKLAYTSGIYNSTSAFTAAMRSDGASYPYVGYMDDVAIWNRALSAVEAQSLYWELDDFAAGYGFSGIFKDKTGVAINCASYPVRANVYPTNNTASAPVKTGVFSNADGSWAIGGFSVAGTKYLVEYEYEGLYSAPDADIAGAQFMTAA